MPEAELKELYDSLNLAMTFKDFQHIQHYFKEEEKRDPSMTEIRVLDTYWSDHCRHTTFSTELTDVKFDEGDYKAPIVDTYKKYLADREELYKGRKDKFVCLMDLALMAMKKLKAEGKLADQEESDEINACSIVVPEDVPLTVKGKMEQKVKKHTIKKLIPLDELKEAVHNGIAEPWELAEYFNVTNKFMIEAMEFYRDNLLI